MSNRLISYEGKTIGIFTITKELGGGKVIAKCNLCGNEKEFFKSNILYGHQKQCKNCPTLEMPKGGRSIISYEGQTVGNFTILKELGKGKILARCNKCGKEREFVKSRVIHGIQKSCGCLKYRDFTGQTIGNFTVLKELGNQKILARCNLCGRVKRIRRTEVISERQKSCGCLKYTNYTGETVGNFTILEELGNKRVIARCNPCGREKEFNKYSIIHGKYKSCGCLKYLKYKNN